MTAPLNRRTRTGGSAHPWDRDCAHCRRGAVQDLGRVVMRIASPYRHDAAPPATDALLAYLEFVAETVGRLGATLAARADRTGHANTPGTDDMNGDTA